MQGQAKTFLPHPCPQPAPATSPSPPVQHPGPGPAQGGGEQDGGGGGLCPLQGLGGGGRPLHLGDEHNTTLEENFKEGRELGENLVACYYCDEPVEKGDVYRIHVANKHGKDLQHLLHQRRQWKIRFDLKEKNEKIN